MLEIMGLTLFVALVASTLLLVRVEGYYNRPRAFLAEGLLNCARQDLQTTLQVQPNISNVVWKPIGSGRRDTFSRKSEAELKVIFSMSPGDMDEFRQCDRLKRDVDLPTIHVSKEVRINETLPIDSPFFADTISAQFREEIRDFVEANGVGKCGLRSEWTDLGELFFPRYYAGVFCEEKNCSIPTGLGCHPNFKQEPLHLFVLIWDCCYVENLDLSGRYVYQCGWRKVSFPLLTFCTCACLPVL